MKSTKCLMIKTKDSRKFFTSQKNMPLLKEFSKTFEAEISIVKANKEVLIDINELPTAICNADYKNETNYVQVKKSRQEMIDNAQKIQEYIIENLKTKKHISLKDLKKKFQKLKLTDSCLSNHLNSIVRKLGKTGKKITKKGTEYHLG